MTDTAQFQEYVERIQHVIRLVDTARVADAAARIAFARRAGSMVYVAGNGGSATTASHFAADLMKNTRNGDLPRPRVVSLTDNVASLTAWANDVSFDRVFAEPIETLGRPDDVFVAISASGKSPNVIAAVHSAQARGMTVIGLTGFDGGQLRQLADISVHVPVASYELSEDAHLSVCHMIVVSMRSPAPTLERLADVSA